MNIHEAEKFAQEIRINGFCIIEDYLSEFEIEKIFSDINSILIAAQSPATRNIDEKYLFLKNNSPVIKSRCYDLFSKMSSLNRAMNKVIIEEIAINLYKSPVLMSNLQVRVDDNSLDRDLPLHQEFNQMSLFNLTLWVPLKDLSQDSGGLKVYPSSHRKGILEHTSYNGYSGLKQEALNALNEELEIRPKKGTAILFHPYLVHGTIPNESENIRWTSVARFNELSHLKYIQDTDFGIGLGYNLFNTLPEYRNKIFPED